MKVEISVVIPCYNQEKYVAECLDSVLAQTFPDFEAIVVNDGSTDESLKILEEYAKKDKRIIILNQSNQGVVASRNNAINVARGKYIYPLDADDLIAPTCLEKLYQAIENHKGDIITSRVLKFGEETGEMFLNKPTKFNLIKENCLVNAALFKKSDFLAVGGYDALFNKGIEDYDLWLNMVLRAKLKIYRVQELLFHYRIKKIEESRNKFQIANHALLLKNIIHSKYPEIKFYKSFLKFCKFFYYRGRKKNRPYVRVIGVKFYLD